MKKLLAVFIGGLCIFGAVNKAHALGDLVAVANNGAYTTIQGRSIDEPLVYGQAIFHFQGIPIGPTTEYFYGTTTTFGTSSPTAGAVNVSQYYDSKQVYIKVGSQTINATSICTIYGAVGTSTPNDWFVIGTRTVNATSSTFIDVSDAKCDWMSVGVRPSSGTATFWITSHLLNFRR